MIFAVDFDGTIVEHKFPHIGPLLPGAKQVINELYDRGHYIIIWTCRDGNGNITEAINFLKAIPIKYDKINENAPFELVGFASHPKIYADVYIDDHNLGGFSGWDAVKKLYLE